MKLPSLVTKWLVADGDSYRISSKALKIVAILLVIIIVLALALGAWGISRQAEIYQLRQNNELQGEQLKLLEQKMEVLDKKMQTLDGLDQDIRQMIKGSETGTLPSDDKATATPKEAKEDPSPKTENLTPTQLSARISNLDRKAQRRLTSFYTLKNVLQDGAGADIQKLQSIVYSTGTNSGANVSIPSIWPAKGVITSPFGGRTDPVYGGGAFHEGLDIANDEGTPIAATAAGTVTFAGVAGGYGNMVEIDHGNGFVTRYGHNSALLVREGDKVLQGQTISLMGSTGKSTGSHVHYEVRVNGTPTDPVLFLPIQ